jgi:hypothetical protein
MSYLNQLTQSAWILYPLIIWSVVWKGLALWYAARAGQKTWYVVLLILNTVGILEIIYIFAVAKRRNQPSAGINPPVAKV